MTEFKDSVGEEFGFYGVDNLMFKLGRYVFEAIEDEGDGYRSHLDTITHVGVPDTAIFSRRSLAKVRVVPVEDGYFEGWHLIDTKDGHVWLEAGTDNVDEYYPCFVFRYHPRCPGESS